MMSKLTQLDAYRLFHDGAIALADVEANGFRIDTDRLDKAIAKTTKKVERQTERLKQDEIWKVWEKTFGYKAKIGSRPQLAKVLFEKMDYESVGETKKARRSRTDEEALESLNIPFVNYWLTTEKLKKLLATSLRGLRNEVVDGYLHVFYNLNLARSFRSSSDSINFQNIPIRDPILGKMIRECFIPREGYQIIEVDYSAMEYKVAACFYRDRNMVAYASDPSKDIHRDMAMECYMLTEDQVTKESRFFAKNQYVFPELYGSSYAPCARNLWSAISAGKLKTKQGVGLKKHMRELANVLKLGKCDYDKKVEPVPDTFEYHIFKVEKRYNARFPQYAKRKEQWWDRYTETGGFTMMTGFEVQGSYSRNQIYNYPIQGPAFHCLLWALIRINNWLKENKMRTVIAGTIHDSILFDAHPDEAQEVMEKAKQVMTVEIRKVWKWIIVPLDVEFEASPVDGSWWEKKEVEI